MGLRWQHRCVRTAFTWPLGTAAITSGYFVYPDCRHMQVVRYQLDVRGFQKWIQKTDEGKQFKAIAGGVSDDALYTLSPMLRDLLPRGLHSVLALPKEGDGSMTKFWFCGIPKFTGLEARDEDEDSNSHQANFFYGGARYKAPCSH